MRQHEFIGFLIGVLIGDLLWVIISRSMPFGSIILVPLTSAAAFGYWRGRRSPMNGEAV